MFRYLTIIAAAALFSLSACAQEPELLVDEEDHIVTNVDASDLEMNAAKTKARATVNLFWDKKDSCQTGCDNFSIKAGLDGPDGIEHIWVSNVARDGDEIVGTLANDPYDLPGLAFGSTVRFTTGQVSDWGYSENGVAHGHYTTRVTLERLPAEKADPVREMLGWD